MRWMTYKEACQWQAKLHANVNNCKVGTNRLRENLIKHLIHSLLQELINGRKNPSLINRTKKPCRALRTFTHTWVWFHRHGWNELWAAQNMAAVSVPRSANARRTWKRHRRQSPQNVQQNVVVYLGEDRENFFRGHFGVVRWTRIEGRIHIVPGVRSFIYECSLVG